jgi:hypothetical protein
MSATAHRPSLVTAAVLLSLGIPRIGASQGLSDRERRIVAFSAYLCVYESGKAEAQEELDKERRYSKIAGAVSASKVYRLQRRIGLFQDGIAKIRASFRKAKVKPEPCSDPLVERLSECLNVWIEGGEIQSEWDTGGACLDGELDPYKIEPG